MGKRIHIVTRQNGVGLSRDTAILSDVLKAYGHDVTVQGVDGQPPASLCGDVSVHLELINPAWARICPVNLLVPNQEWYEPHWNRYLALFDMVLTKTRYADMIFRELGCTTEYIGFTTPDRCDPAVQREQEFLHVAGKSQFKGTRAVLEAWLANPEFPHLTVISHAFKFQGDIPPNVTLITEPVPDATLKEWQNRCLYHLCPSEAEGYGHYIAEALSVGAVVISTNAPPMNELITPSRGVLVPATHAERFNYGERFFVASEAIADAVRRALALPDTAPLQQAAQHYYAESTDFFRRKLHAILEAL